MANSITNYTFTNPLKVLVVDQLGDPVEGVTVTFTAPASGASGVFTDSGTNVITAVTDVSGIATASSFTAGRICTLLFICL